MFSHVMIGSDDLVRSKLFYDAIFSSMGAKPGRKDDHGRLVYLHKGAVFMIGTPIDGGTATHGNGSTIGFSLESPEQVHSWHDAAVAAGGTPIEDDPGVRHRAFGRLYLAYVRDPDGNKLCGLHRLPLE